MTHAVAEHPFEQRLVLHVGLLPHAQLAVDGLAQRLGHRHQQRVARRLRRRRGPLRQALCADFVAHAQRGPSTTIVRARHDGRGQLAFRRDGVQPGDGVVIRARSHIQDRHVGQHSVAVDAAGIARDLGIGGERGVVRGPRPGRITLGSW